RGRTRSTLAGAATTDSSCLWDAVLHGKRGASVQLLDGFENDAGRTPGPGSSPKGRSTIDPCAPAGGDGAAGHAFRPLDLRRHSDRLRRGLDPGSGRDLS